MTLKDTRPKILIVDDKEDNLLALERTLEDTGAEIVRAGSGNLALERTLDHEFALAILDVRMPGMDGFELAELLRGDTKTRDMPIIFLSAEYSEKQHIFRGYQSGGMDYLVKPVDPALLLNKVSVFLHIDRQRRELIEANLELDSFSYSVSHDLRSPLRAVDGYSQVLLDEYGDALGAEGQRLLGRIRENAAQMSQLIDDLLSFSRMSRKKMSSSAIDMVELVEEVIDALGPDIAKRQVQLDIGALPPARGDRSMIRVVLTNILSNAIKFTASRETAVIEIRGAGRGLESVYSVSDNGVGFDMQYADQLFEVFKRLHDRQAFEGTGIGLAIAQRIVHRHGGRIWAESELDCGASFHFALPADD